VATASVWNWDRLDYDYYRTPEKADLGGWHTLSGLGVGGVTDKNALGIDIEDALPILPKGSKKIGRGVKAKGRIMKLSGGLGSTSLAQSKKEINWTPFVVAGALFLLWRHLR
tara:strand:- start:176 stop:511 length:336 start_codon:yes stop_codon:yes gene_type:complete